MRPLQAPGWTVSFADLVLLLLAFFVLLQSTGGRGVAAAARAAFSDTAAVDPPLLAAPAASLFEPGEARLTARARAQLATLAAAAPEGGTVVVTSEGRNAGARRFDGWELAAARTAALARALAEGGVPEQRIVIRMPAHDSGKGRQELTIRLSP